MPKFLEDKLKKEYGKDSKIPYKVMNAKGFMHGNKETAKGAAAQKKHEEDEEDGMDTEKEAYNKNKGGVKEEENKKKPAPKIKTGEHEAIVKKFMKHRGH